MNLSKTKLLIASLFLGAFVFQGFKGEKPAQQWYKGNLHTHSYWSDGDAFPEVVMDWYKSHDYNFVALSDHNTLVEGEKWKLIPKNPIHLKAFDDYRTKYGKDWFECKEDTGRISVKLKTCEEYKPLFEEKGKFLIIPSEEISDRFEEKPIHLNVTNIQKLIPPQNGKSIADVLQNNINAAMDQQKETGIPMMVQINHPNFRYAFSAQEMIALEEARFVEVFNGHPQVNNLGDSTHLGIEALWDVVNIAFLEQGKPFLYGLATDDSHNYHVFESKYGNPGRGWVMVQASELTPESLIQAMDKGDFYASTGVTLKEVSFKNKQLKISVKPETGVNYKIQFIGCKVKDKKTSILKETEGKEATFKLDQDILFVRAKIISNKLKKSPFHDKDYEEAWSQPVR